MITYEKIADLVQLAIREECTIGDVVARGEADLSGHPLDKILGGMQKRLDVMREAAQNGLQSEELSLSGLSGKDAKRFAQHAAKPVLVGKGMADAMKIALAVSEENARMGRIVAAPTAGACGILPGVLLGAASLLGSDDVALVNALFTAGGIGQVIDANATISGAEGGCQAECGSAAAMAAAAVAQLAGASPEQAATAMAIALKNMLGLVCDPVGGLVEVPCIKRNGMAVATAFAAAEMALAGIESVISPDDVVAAMRDIGRRMPASLKETSLAGLAVTESASKALCAKRCTGCSS